MRELSSKTKKTLEKQMQLLSERSQDASNADVTNMTYAMCDIARLLSSRPNAMSSAAFEAKLQTGSQSDRSTGVSTLPSNISQSEQPVT